MPKEEFAKSRIEEMIQQYASIDKVIRDCQGFDLWKLSTGVIIRLPSGNGRIDEVVVSEIAETKLEIPSWEYDYWLGQQ